MQVCEYALLSKAVYQNPDLSQLKGNFGYLLPVGWQLIAISSDGVNTALQHGFFGAAFAKNKEVVIATRGTLFDIEQEDTFIGGIGAIFDDIRLFQGDMLEQFQFLQSFVSKVKAQVHHDQILKFTGHSLGAALSEIAAAFYNKEAVVFDNPGAKKIIDKYQYAAGKVSFSVTSVQGKPNIINTCCEKYGQIVQLKYDSSDYNNGIDGFLEAFVGAESHSLDSIIKALGCSNELNFEIL